LFETAVALPQLPPGETIFVQGMAIGSGEAQLTRIADAMLP
jgi:hypothetical protein